MAGKFDAPRPNPEYQQMQNFDRYAAAVNFLGFLQKRGLTEKQVLAEYGVDTTPWTPHAGESVLKKYNVSSPEALPAEGVKEYKKIQDYHNYISFYIDLFNATAQDTRPIQEKTPSFPVLFSLVHMLKGSGEVGEVVEDKNILGEFSYPLAALFAATAEDPDLPLTAVRDLVAIKLHTGLAEGGWGTMDVVIKKEDVVEALVGYMLHERKIGYETNSKQWDYEKAGNAVKELVQKYRDELDTLDPQEARLWRRNKYIFNPAFEEDLQKYIDTHVQFQTAWKARDAAREKVAMETTCTQAHFARFAEMLGITGELPEKYKAVLENALAYMKQNPQSLGYELERVGGDVDDFIITMLFHTVISGGNNDTFVTRQFPQRRRKEGVIRFAFGGKHLGRKTVLFPEHTVDVVGYQDPQTNRYKHKIAE